MNKNILVTGCAGFIGFSTSKVLLQKGYKIYGVDNLSDYYSVKLKKDVEKTEMRETTQNADQTDNL